MNDDYILLGEAHLENLFYELAVHLAGAKKQPGVYIEFRRAMLLRSSIPALIREFSPEVVYFEGHRDSGTIVGEGTDDLAKKAKKEGAKAVFLDEGVRAYDILGKMLDLGFDAPFFNFTLYPAFYYLNRTRENTWLEKMLDNGPGMALMGAAHLKRMDTLLSDAGQQVVQKDLWKETRKYARELRKKYGREPKEIIVHSWCIEERQ